MKVCETVFSLNLVNAQADLLERIGFIRLEIGERHFDDATLEGVICIFKTGCAVDQGLADTGTRNLG
jgi:hypothetical protein